MISIIFDAFDKFDTRHDHITKRNLLICSPEGHGEPRKRPRNAAFCGALKQGAKSSFAHSPQELVDKPDLFHTRLCTNMVKKIGGLR